MATVGQLREYGANVEEAMQRCLNNEAFYLRLVNVALGDPCTETEYRTQFALWCMMGAPLMIGGDVRNMDEASRTLLQNSRLLRINQDPECRPPMPVYRGRVIHIEYDPETGWWHEYPDSGLTLFRHLSGGEFAVGYFNFAPKSGEVPFIFADAGLPYGSGVGLRLTDAFTGEDLGVKRDYLNLDVEGHGCRILLGRLEKL